MYQDVHELSLRELFSRLSAEISRMIKTDIALIRTEVSGKVSRLKVDLILITGGAFMLLISLLVLIATVIIALSYAMPAWLSALIVGLFLLIVGGVLALVGIRRMRTTEWTPRQSAQILKEEGTWLKQQLA